ncbi:MAG: ABC transporter ATP-binding protein [Verrucomicrobia bacterium]|nr:ABC transporter ATP-binding protein [Verrucomicrobiota bacterium]
MTDPANSQRPNADNDLPAGKETLLSLRGVSKSYRLWHKPYERFLYGTLNSVPRCAPGVLRRAAATRKEHLGTEVFALSEINLDIERGGSIGVIGRNGSGKSTLLQLIAGVLQPTTGQISVKTKRVAALLELGSSFEPEFTGRENVLLHGAMLDIPEEENQGRLQEVLDFSEIGEYFEQPVRTYSSGMMLRLAFASSITLRPDLLIVDEALSVGDIFFQQRCFEKIRELVAHGVTIFLASHDLRSIGEFCERTLLMNEGRVAFFGDSKTAIDHYYGLTQSDRMLRATKSAMPLGDSIEPDMVGHSSSGVALEPVKSMHPNRDAAARFLGFAVMDQAGKHTGFFRQGDWLTIIYDIEVRAEIENLSCGIVYRDDRGFFLHAKYLFQDDVRKPRNVKVGERLRATISSRLDVNAGSYTLGLDLISVPDLAFEDGKLTFAAFELHHRRVCTTPGLFAFTVSFNPEREGAEFTHLGLFDLPSRMSLEQVNR